MARSTEDSGSRDRRTPHCSRFDAAGEFDVAVTSDGRITIS